MSRQAPPGVGQDYAIRVVHFTGTKGLEFRYFPLRPGAHATPACATNRPPPAIIFTTSCCFGLHVLRTTNQPIIPLPLQV